MYIGLDEEQQALRSELRAYYADLLTEEVREALHEEAGCGPVHRQVIRKMGQDGWLGPNSSATIVSYQLNFGRRRVFNAT